MGSTFRNKKYGKHSICPITHTRLRPGKNKQGIPYIIVLKCNHIFYRKAFEEWAKEHDTCPLCRCVIKSDK